MTGKLIIYRGLPGSGKTTSARKEKSLWPHQVVLAGRDHIRRRLGIEGGAGTPAQESQVTAIQDQMIQEFLGKGHVVHVDDMNLKEAYVKRLLKLAVRSNATTEFVDLRDVPLEDCITRDAQRKSEGGHYVGEARIRDLHRRYIAQKARQEPKVTGRKGMPETYKPALYTPDASLQRAFLVDIDGTVARRHEDRSFHDYNDKVLLDYPQWHVIDIVRGQIQLGWWPVFLSGRMDSCYGATRMWLNKYVTTGGPLYMRKTGDYRPDYEVKDELFEMHVREQYAVRFALDDRNQVVDLWRAKGIPCLQVAEGNF